LGGSIEGKTGFSWKRNFVAMACIVVAHILVAFAWPERSLQSENIPAFTSELVLVVAVRSAPIRPVARKLARQAKRKQVSRSIAGPSLPAAVTLPTEVLAPVAPPLNEPAPTAATAIVDNALREAGKIDRELRRNSPNPAERALALTRSRQERIIADAFRRDEGSRIVELELPDGRRMSKVITPFGSYCVFKESNAIVGGRDVFKDGVKNKVASCP
jgi:hypothetical protein